MANKRTIDVEPTQPGAGLAWVWGAAGLLMALAPVFAYLDAKLLVAHAALAAVLAAMALGLLGAQALEPKAPEGGLLAAVAGLLAATLLSWRFGGHTAQAAGEVGRMLVFAGLGLAASATPLDAAGVRRVARLWLLGAGLAALYALLQRLGLDPVAAYRAAHSADRAMATFGNPTFLAAYLACMAPLALAAGFGPAATGGLMALLFAAALATGSRAGLLALWLQAGLGLWLGRGALRAGARWRLPAAAAAWLALPLLLWLALGAGLWLRPTLRLQIWAETWRQCLAHPLLGAGPGGFMAAFNAGLQNAGLHDAMAAGNQFAEHPHNFILAQAFETGLIGLAALAGVVWAGVRRMSQARDGRQALWRALLAAGVLGALAQNLFDRNLKLAGTAFFVWAMLGFGAPGRAFAGRLKPAMRRGLAAPLLALAALAMWAGARPALDWRAVSLENAARERAGQGAAGREAGLRAALAAGPATADLYTDLGNSLAEQTRWAEAAEAFGQALRLDPAGRAAAINLGNCRFQMNRLPEAEQAYRLAVRIDPQSADAHFDLGYALYYQRRMKEALAEFDAALAIDPGYAKARKLKEMLGQ